MIRVEDGLPVRPLPECGAGAADRPGDASLPAPVAGVETAVRTVVQNVLNGLFGRN